MTTWCSEPLTGPLAPPEALVGVAGLDLLEACAAHQAPDPIHAGLGGGAAALGQERPALALPGHVERLELERSRRQRPSRLTQDRRIVSVAAGGGCGLGARVQAHVHRGEHAQGSERAAEQLGHVVAGHVLDHLPAGSGHRAVSQNDRHPQDQVPRGAVAVRQGPGVRRGQDAADRGLALGPQPRVQGQHLPRPGEGLLRLGQRDSGFEHRRQVTGVVLPDPIQARGVELIRGPPAASPSRAWWRPRRSGRPRRRPRSSPARPPSPRRWSVELARHLEPRGHAGSLQRMLAVGPGNLSA